MEKRDVIDPFKLFSDACIKARYDNSINAYLAAIDCYPRSTAVKIDKHFVSLIDCHISLAELFEREKKSEFMLAELSEAQLLMNEFQQCHPMTNDLTLIAVNQGTKLVGPASYRQSISFDIPVKLEHYIKNTLLNKPRQMTPKYVIGVLTIKLSMMYAQRAIVQTDEGLNRNELKRALKTFSIGTILLKQGGHQLTPYLLSCLKDGVECLMQIPYTHQCQEELKFLKVLTKDITKDEGATSLTVFEHRDKLNQANEMIESASRYALNSVHSELDYIINWKSKWMKKDGLQKGIVETVKELHDDLQQKKITIEHNSLLMQECHIWLAALSEHRPIVATMQQAAMRLFPLAAKRQDETFIELCSNLQEMNRSQNRKGHLDTFYKPLMFSFLNLSEQYIQQEHIRQAARVLYFADHYFQMNNKQTKITEEYVKRFLRVFKDIVQLRVTHLGNDVDDFPCMSDDLKFNDIVLSALPFLKSDQHFMKLFYDMIVKCDNRVMRDVGRKIDFGYDFSRLKAIINRHREGTTLVDRDLKHILAKLHDAAYQSFRYISQDRVYLVEGYAFIASLTESHRQPDKMKKPLLWKATPLIRLYADPFEKETSDVKTFEQRCKQLRKLTPKQASEIILPLLCLQLELQASVMYCELDKPRQALKTLSAAIESYKANSVPSMLEKDDYKRLLKSALLLGNLKFNTIEDWQCLEKCLRTVSSMSQGQKQLPVDYQHNLLILTKRVKQNMDSFSKRKKNQQSLDPLEKFKMTFERARKHSTIENYDEAINGYPPTRKVSLDIHFVHQINCYISLAMLYSEEKKFRKNMGATLLQALELMDMFQKGWPEFYKGWPEFYNDANILRLLKPMPIGKMISHARSLEKGAVSIPDELLISMMYLNLANMYRYLTMMKSDDKTRDDKINYAFDSFGKGLSFFKKLPQDYTVGYSDHLDQLYCVLECLSKIPLVAGHHEKENYQLKDLIVNVIHLYRKLFNDRWSPGRRLKKMLRQCIDFEKSIPFYAYQNIREKLVLIMRHKSDWLSSSERQLSFSQDISGIGKKLANMKAKNTVNNILQQECEIFFCEYLLGTPEELVSILYPKKKWG